MDAADQLTDAEERYLTRIAADCAGWLGTEADLLDLRRETAGEDVRLVARYRLGKRVRASQGIGDTLLSAHEMLRARILFDRMQFGLSDYLERR